MPKKNIQDLITYHYTEGLERPALVMTLAGGTFVLGKGDDGDDAITGSISNIVPLGLRVSFDGEHAWYEIDIEAFVRTCDEHRQKVKREERNYEVLS